jgi:hypothetical protein
MTAWPQWWEWELELTPHLLKRMIDRQFNEADLRQMLEDAANLRDSHEEGRFVVESIHDGRPWEVIVEPLSDEKVVLVITAYTVD